MKLLIQLVIALFIIEGSYAQTENFWTKKADFGGLKRERAVSFSIGSFGYVGTGVDTNEIVLKDFWKYDPVNDTWTQVATLPGSQRRNAVGFAIGNLGYVGIGINTASAADLGATILNDFWEYDPTLNSWTVKAIFPGGTGSGLYFSTGFSIDTKGYVCGGKRGPNSYVSEFWEYKQSLDTWVQLPNFPGGVRYQLASFSIGFKGYVGLGTDQDVYRNDLWEFDAATNSWTQLNDFPASERASVSTFSIGDRGYICMGSNGGLLDDLWQYNPYTDLWLPKSDFGGSKRKNAISFTINGKAYVGTGKGFSGKKSSMYEYTPNSVLGFNDLEFNVSVYPNPTSDFLNLDYQTTQIESIEIYTMTGRKVFEASQVSQINVQDYQAGAYILIAKQANGKLAAKQNIIIQ